MPNALLWPQSLIAVTNRVCDWCVFHLLLHRGLASPATSTRGSPWSSLPGIRGQAQPASVVRVGSFPNSSLCHVSAVATKTRCVSSRRLSSRFIKPLQCLGIDRCNIIVFFFVALDLKRGFSSCTPPGLVLARGELSVSLKLLHRSSSRISSEPRPNHCASVEPQIFHCRALSSPESSLTIGIEVEKTTMVIFALFAHLALRPLDIYFSTPKLLNVKKGPPEATPKLLIAQSNPRKYSEFAVLVPDLLMVLRSTPNFVNCNNNLTV